MKGSLLPLAITLAIQSLVSMASLTVPVLGPAISADTGLRVELIGVYIGGVYLTAMVSTLVSGAMIGRKGPIRISQYALGFCVVGLLVALLDHVLAFALSALLVGMGYGMVTPASSHILARTTPPERMGLVFSLKQTGVPLGVALAGLFCPPIEQASSWQVAVIAVAVASGLVALLAQILRPSLDAERDTSAATRFDVERFLRPFRLIFADKALRDIALTSAVYGAAQLCVTTYIMLWLVEVYQQDLIKAGLMMTVAQVGGVVGRLLWGWVADRLRAPRLVLAGLGLTVAVCFGLLAVAGPGWHLAVILPLIAISGATAIGWNGVYLAEVARLAPSGQASVVTGGTLFFTYSGVMAGPPIFAAILTASGSFSVGFLVFSLTMGLSAALLALTGKGRVVGAR